MGIWTGSQVSPGGSKRQASRRRGGDQRLKIPELCSVSQLRRICMEIHSPHTPIPALSPYLISRGVLKVRNPISLLAFSSHLLPLSILSLDSHTPNLLQSLSGGPYSLRALKKEPGKEMWGNQGSGEFSESAHLERSISLGCTLSSPQGDQPSQLAQDHPGISTESSTARESPQSWPNQDGRMKALWPQLTL